MWALLCQLCSRYTIDFLSHQKIVYKNHQTEQSNHMKIKPLLHLGYCCIIVTLPQQLFALFLSWVNYFTWGNTIVLIKRAVGDSPQSVQSTLRSQYTGVIIIFQKWSEVNLMIDLTAIQPISQHHYFLVHIDPTWLVCPPATERQL